MSDVEKPVPATPGEAKPKRRSWRWRFLRFVVVSFFGLVTLFVLFHAVENWRGKRAWDQHRKEQEAKGVSFDFNSIVPPPVPEEKNFAMTPLLKPMLELNPPGGESRFKDAQGYEKTDLGLNPLPLDSTNVTAVVHYSPLWRRGQRMDLAIWQAAIFDSTNLLHRTEKGDPAEDVLFAFKKHEVAMAELHQARKERPLSRYGINYDQEDKTGILLPHLSRLKSISQAFRLRAVSYLAAGRIDEAFEDVNLIFTLGDSVRSEPLLISYLVRIACVNMALQTIWEGTVDHKWKPEHLMFWQTKLAGYDLIKDSFSARLGERAFGLSTIDYVRIRPYLAVFAFEPGSLFAEPDTASAGGRFVASLVPKGWFYLEKISYDRIFSDFLLGPEGKDKSVVDVQKLSATSDRMDDEFSRFHIMKTITEHRVMARLLVPAMGRFCIRSVYAQSTVDLTSVALALEQYHLKRGDYPASLKELESSSNVPLPLDLVSRADFRYERQSNESYKLWSVGWNLKDDNGKIEHLGGPTGAVKLEEGDWTWPQLERKPKPSHDGFE